MFLKKNLKPMAIALLLSITVGSMPVMTAYGEELTEESATDEFQDETDQNELSPVSPDNDNHNSETEGIPVEDNVLNESGSSETEEEELYNITRESGNDLPASGIPSDDTSNDRQESEQVTDISVGEINFVYIESPYITTPDTERVVLAFDREITGADEISIVVEDSMGNQESWNLSKQAGSLYLFEKNYIGIESTGTYKVTSLELSNDMSEQSFTMESLNVDAEFGVNEEYDGIDELQPLSDNAISDDGSVGATVVTIDESGVAQAQESIQDALNQVGSEVNSQSSLLRSRSAEARTGNIVVALDPGHDANDAGAQGYGLKEEDLTLKIAMYCKQELEQYAGVSVYMTRTGAACPYNCTSAGSCIKQRVQAAVNAGASIYVSFHLNASVASGANGAEIIVPNYNWKYQVGAEGRALAQEILSQLTALGLSNRGIYSKDTSINEKYDDGSLSDYFSVQIYCKENNIPGIIVEHAFITNGNDVNRFLTTESGLKKLGVADATGIANYLGLMKGKWVQDGSNWKFQLSDGSYLKSSFITVDGKTYYLNSSGNRVTGLCYIGAGRYFFNSDGSMATKTWKTISGKTYYFTSSGQAVVGLCYIGSSRYYFDTDGSMCTDLWVEVSGKRYYFASDGKAATGFQTIDGRRYYFNTDGSVCIKSWATIDGKKYYFNSSGQAVTGLVYIGSFRYYFNSDGTMVSKAWKTIDSSTYYFNSSGRAVTGLVYIGSSRYYFDNDGSMLKEQWITVDSNKYYLTKEGSVAVGLRDVDGKMYYFNTDGTVSAKTWAEVDGKKYFFNSSGQAVTGLVYIGTARYYFNSDGTMVSRAWETVGSSTYYFNSSGCAVTGLVYIGSSRYYFDSDGSMLKEQWITVDSNKYYLTKEGSVAVGLRDVDGKMYYFNTDGTVSAKTWAEVDGKKYFFNSSGQAVTGLVYIGTARYYFNSDGTMVSEAWETVGSSTYYFNSSGRAVTGLVYIGSSRYYFNSDGSMVTKTWVSVDGTKYYLTSSGKAAVGLCYIGAGRYYFNDDGSMLTNSWKSVDNEVFYFTRSGIAATGMCYVGSEKYFFDDAGVLRKGENSIAGETTTTVNKMVEYFTQNNTYPSYYENTDAPTISDFCKIYYEEAAVEGIRAEVAFSQAMLETNWLRFTGDVSIEQFNFAGIGTTGNGVVGASFENVREGIRAQIQHLKAYANELPLNNSQVDPRFHLVTRGCAPYVEWLGQQENPAGYGWATGKNYGYNILRLMKELDNI